MTSLFDDGDPNPPKIIRPELHEIIFDDWLKATPDRIAAMVENYCTGIGGVWSSAIASSRRRASWIVAIFGESENDGYLSSPFGSVRITDTGQPTCKVRVTRHFDNDLVPTGTREILVQLVWVLLAGFDTVQRAAEWRNGDTKSVGRARPEPNSILRFKSGTVRYNERGLPVLPQSIEGDTPDDFCAYWYESTRLGTGETRSNVAKKLHLEDRSFGNKFTKWLKANDLRPIK